MHVLGLGGLSLNSPLPLTLWSMESYLTIMFLNFPIQLMIMIIIKWVIIRPCKHTPTAQGMLNIILLVIYFIQPKACTHWQRREVFRNLSLLCPYVNKNNKANSDHLPPPRLQFLPAQVAQVLPPLPPPSLVFLLFFTTRRTKWCNSLRILPLSWSINLSFSHRFVWTAHVAGETVIPSHIWGWAIEQENIFLFPLAWSFFPIQLIKLFILQVRIQAW